MTVTARDPEGLAADHEFMVTMAPGLRRLGIGFAAGYNSPAWSPDGARIAFYSYRDGNPEIYVMSADGSGVERLTDNSAEDGWPAWSPDGARIAFASDRDGNWEIYVMNADGSDVEQPTNDSAADRSPTWSPDGARIALGSTRDVSWDIYVMNADGSDVERLTNTVTGHSSPRGPRMGPKSLSRRTAASTWRTSQSGDRARRAPARPPLRFPPRRCRWISPTWVPAL